ncbi:hypothetical protein J2Z19_003759 [Ensifer adhaerens]|uniref:Uncharacterized protein n=1 Tax=Ensifer adhaerens TaxID=106592 RepID=A0ACC5SYY5_ENSAD|nr:hypothetical protein [Ensifer adhaerens]MBP1874035.1 hypothetical protein [Ensifer adhaerens]
MPEDRTVKLTFRLDADVHNAISTLASKAGFETNSFIQQILTNYAIEYGGMADTNIKRLLASQEIINLTVSLARKLYGEGKFDENFVLKVFQHAMDDPQFLAKYERAIDGKAYDVGVPGKTPLNMYLGWYIKNAVGAEPQLHTDGKPRRVQVKNEPIQSYTLLKEGSGPHHQHF